MAALLSWQAYRVVEALAALAAAGQMEVLATADAIAGAAFNLEVEIAALESGIRPYLARFGSRAISSMYDQYGIGADVTIETDFIRDLLQAQESRFARDVTATSVQGIRDEIAKGIAAGEGHYQLRERILAYYDRTSQWRADLAAQYESGTAYEAVREALALQQGMTHKRWETMRDDRVERVCLDNEAAGSIPINDLFPSGHTRPLAHPLCRCWLSYSAE